MFVVRFFNILFTFLKYAIFIDAILSWLPQSRDNSLTQILHTITEPFMRPGRMLQQRLMPGLMIDFSPVVALLIIEILRNLVNRIFYFF